MSILDSIRKIGLKLYDLIDGAVDTDTDLTVEGGNLVFTIKIKVPLLKVAQIASKEINKK